MMKFEKGYNLRIVLVAISIVFLCNTTVYAYLISKDTLRLHIGDEDGDDTYRRFQKLGLLQAKQAMSLEEYVAFLNRVTSQIEVAPGISLTGAVEVNGRVWFEFRTEDGLFCRVEDTLLIERNLVEFQHYFNRFIIELAGSQESILEVQSILSFTEDNPVLVYIGGDRDAFLSFRGNIPIPDWADVYDSFQGLVFDWEGVCARLEEEDFGGRVIEIERYVESLRHELVHSLIGKDVFNNDRELRNEMWRRENPVWLEEGLAVAISSSRDIEEDMNCLVALIGRKGIFPSLSSLRESIFSVDDDIVLNNVGYQTCGVFVRYIAQQLDSGYDIIFMAMQRMVEERIPFEQALFDLTRIDVYEVEQQWRQQIAAEVAIAERLAQQLNNVVLFDGDEVLAQPGSFSDTYLAKGAEEIFVVGARSPEQMEAIERELRSIGLNPERDDLKVGILKGPALEDYDIMLRAAEVFGNFKVIRGRDIDEERKNLREAVIQI
ncbi:MAG: hypothetical protein KKA34_02115 [Candidatus Omnitrophica bacterium]|nr:hypothetical protein [Candidatus Omnitrophota bacterium]